MSTALVSAFYDVGDVLYKQASRSQLRSDRKAVGTPIGTTLQRRNSANATLSNGIGSGNINKIAQISTTLVSGLNESTILNNKENRQRDRAFSESEGLNSKRNQINSSRYKTELCRPFEENGTCKYGDKCQFAHGGHELRSLNRHPKYKTELCRTFHTVGFCPYGPRCHFIHSAEEKRTPQQNVQDNNVRNVSTSSITRSVTIERPKTLFHSLSFSGTPSTDLSQGMSPTSITPPPALFHDDGIQLNFNTTNSLNNNVNNADNSSFNFSQDLPPLISPMSPSLGSPNSPFNYPSPLPVAINDTLLHQHLMNDNLNSVFLSDDGSLSPTPSDSLSGSDQDSAGGSMSPLDPRRLPIFSRLSIDE